MACHAQVLLDFDTIPRAMRPSGAPDALDLQKRQLSIARRRYTNEALLPWRIDRYA